MGLTHEGVLQAAGRELHDMRTARVSREVRLLEDEVIETVPYDCVVWTLNTAHNDELRHAHLEVLRVFGFQRLADYVNLSYAKALKGTKRESIETTTTKKRFFVAGAVVRQTKGRLLTQSNDVCVDSR